MSEAMGWLMIVAGVVLGCSAIVALRAGRLYGRKDRLWKAWRGERS
jgi:hypothetical protein